MDDDAWVDEERELGGACPACGAADARPVVYGSPDLDLYEQLAGRVAFLGCCALEVGSRWACGSCSTLWGERVLPEPEDPWSV